MWSNAVFSSITGLAQKSADGVYRGVAVAATTLFESPTKVARAVTVIGGMAKDRIETLQAKAAEAAESLRLAPSRAFKRLVDCKTNGQEIKAALDADPLLPIARVPDCDSQETSYSFLAYTGTSREHEGSFESITQHNNSMIACLLNPETDESDIARILTARPELLLQKIENRSKELKPGPLFSYAIREGNTTALEKILKAYSVESVRARIESEDQKKIGLKFRKYYRKYREDTQKNSIFNVLCRYSSVFGNEEPKAMRRETVALGDTPLGTDKPDPQSETKSVLKENSSEAKINYMNFHLTVNYWYMNLQKHVWFFKGAKLNLIRKLRAEDLYKAAKSIESNKDDNTRKLTYHRRWSLYFWCMMHLDIKQAPSTCAEILLLAVSLDNYKRPQPPRKKQVGKIPALQPKDVPLSDEIAHGDFQEAACYAYLKNRGSVWFSKGNASQETSKAFAIANANPAVLYTAARLLHDKIDLSVTPTNEAHQDTEARELAKKLSAHRRWSFWPASLRARTTCAQAVVSVLESRYKSLRPQTSTR